MSRHYQPDPRGKHTTENINRALADHRRGLPFRAFSKSIVSRSQCFAGVQIILT